MLTTTAHGRFISHVATWQVPLHYIPMLGSHMPTILDLLGIAMDIDSATLFGGTYKHTERSNPTEE